MENQTAIIIAIIAAIPPTLVAFLSLLQTRKVHYLINSRMTELLKASKGESLAEGREIGRRENKKVE